MKWIALLLASSAIADRERPISGVKAEARECPELLRLDPVNGAADGARVAADKPYLMGVYGYTTDVPGRIRYDLPVRMLESTSDDECPELNSRTREYAKRFNEAVQANAKE